MDDSNAIWSALASLYDEPGVKDACLALQERNGVCVTALLTLICAAARGHGAPHTPTVCDVVTISEAFEADVMRPLRRARNGLREMSGKDGTAADLRAGLLNHELALERFLQDRILDVLSSRSALAHPQTPPVDTGTGTRRYLTALGIEPTSDVLDRLGPILSAALPEAGSDAVIAAIAGDVQA